jgi:hypothetical protein
MKLVTALALLLCLVIAFGCSKGKAQQHQTQPAETTKTGAPETTRTSMLDDPAQPAAGFGKDVQPLFTKKCANTSCHGADKSGGMQLTKGMAYANIVNVKSTEEPQFMRVKPGAPDSSYLVLKIEGHQKVGMRMPLVGGPLSDKQIQIVRSWIQAGAKNN